MASASIDVAAGDEMVCVAEQAAGAGRLQRTADRGCVVGGAVDRPVCGRGAGVAATGRTGDRLAVLVEEGKLVVERGGHRVREGKRIVLQAQMIEELRIGAAAAALHLR